MTTVPLARALTDAGYGARRRVVVLIKSGLVEVNGRIASSYTEPVDPTTDHIVVAGRRTAENKPRRVYIALNKPEGYLSTTEDDRGRPTVIDLLPEPLRKAGLHPAGRLDEDSTGLLIMTNDGQLTYELTHPRFEHDKEYYVALTGNLPADDIRRLEEGVEIEGQRTWPAQVRRIVGESPYGYSVTIHEGRKRQVRMMFAAVNQQVALLKRVRVGGLTLGDIPEGGYRELTTDEVRRLMRPTSRSGHERGATTRWAPPGTRQAVSPEGRRSPTRPRTSDPSERRAERPRGIPPDRGARDDSQPTRAPRYRTDRTQEARPRERFADGPRGYAPGDREGAARPRYHPERSGGPPQRRDDRFSDRPQREEYGDRRGPARPPYRSQRPEDTREGGRERYEDRPRAAEFKERRGPASPRYRQERTDGPTGGPRGRFTDGPRREEYRERQRPERPPYRSDREEAPPGRRPPRTQSPARDYGRDARSSKPPASRSRRMPPTDYEDGSAPDRRERPAPTRPPARGSGVTDRPGAARQGKRSPRTQRPTADGASRPPSRQGPPSRGTQRRTSPGEGRRPPSERR